MNNEKRWPWNMILTLLAVVAIGVGGAAAAWATDGEAAYYDKAVMRVHADESTMDVSAAVYTGWIPLLTIAPPAGVAMEDVRVVVDLDKVTTGFADATGWDTETMQLSIARKVDGTNWRTAHNLIVPSSAIAADDADNLSIEIPIGHVGPNEGVRIMIKVSAEAAADAVFPYVAYYKSSSRATFTDVDP